MPPLRISGMLLPLSRKLWLLKLSTCLLFISSFRRLAGQDLQPLPPTAGSLAWSSHTPEPSSPQSLAPAANVWSSPTLSMVAHWDGTVTAMDNDSGDIRWSLSSGPPLNSAHGLIFDNEESLNATHGVTCDLESENDRYYFCGHDWKLYTYDKRLGTEDLPVAPEELIKNTPAFLDGAVVLGSITQTTFIVDATSGVLIRRIDSGDAPILQQEKIAQEQNIHRILEPTLISDNVKPLFIFRTDYSLRSVASASGKLLWNVSIGQIRLHYPNIDVVYSLPASVDMSKAKNRGQHLEQLPARNLFELPPPELISHSRSKQPLSFPISSLNMKNHNGNNNYLSFQTSYDDPKEKALATLPLPLNKDRQNDLFSDIIFAVTNCITLGVSSFSISTFLSKSSLICLLFIVVFASIKLGVRSWKAYSSNKQDEKVKEVANMKKRKGRKGGNRNGKSSDLKMEQSPSESSFLQGNKIMEAADSLSEGRNPSNLDLESERRSGNASSITGVKGINSSGYADGRWVGRLFITNTIIGYGSHGTMVFEGFLDTRNVAIKRLLGQFYEKAQKELVNLIASDEHPNVVRCYAMESDADFVYVALERCSFNLNEFILFHRLQHYGSSSSNTKDLHLAEFDIKHLVVEVGDAKNLRLWGETGRPSPSLIQFMRDIVAGLAHLHDLGIVHRDLKPQNVLISNGRICCAKLSDMGISKRLVDDASSLDTYTAGVGSSGWQAPEQLLSHRQTRAVDLFSLGCVLFFCMSGGNHPFGSRFERDRNIVNSQPDLFLIEHIPEATHLISALLDRDPQKRPSVKDVLMHPLFWNSEKRLSFLKDASDRVELEDRVNQSPLWDALEAAASCALGGAWDEKLETIFLENLGRYRRYNYSSVRDLLRVIRNKANHYRELPEDVQQLLGPVPHGYETYFRNKFPCLLIEIYKVLYSHCSRETVFQAYFGS